MALLHINTVCMWYCCCSVAKSCPTLCNPMKCSTPGSPIPHYLPEFAQIHVHWVSDAIHPSHPLLPSSLFVFNLSQHQGLFQWVGSSQQVAKVLELQLLISPYNEYSSLISIRIEWIDLIAVQGTLKSLLQHHSSKASILGHSALLMVQLSYPYLTTGKTKTLTNGPLLAKWCLCFLICCLGIYAHFAMLNY